ncbi:hypothetical protein [Streptomyces subrutilus]|uniref:Uncharacterized protein n=1 Tax=Streptomyces subrutilus TaxID=36818 RepID=A0A1E5PYJ4_9ACTN|nr:hypothetical protein [Streptomyces subrutilus]OEJ34520.1 hypothetical protein BGK67_27125 [Streptomyces subrutilus]
MRAQRAKRLFVVSAAGLLMAGGAALGTAGTASAATPTQTVSYVTGGWDHDDDDDYGGHGGWRHGGWDHDDDNGYGGHGHGGRGGC